MRWCVAAVALLAGCAGFSPYDNIDTRPADKSYLKVEFTVASGGGWRSGTDVVVYLKTFEAEGKLAVCGFYTAGGSSSLYTEMVGAQFASHDSALTVNGDLIGNLGFLRWNGSEREAVANCVRSRIAWKPGYARAQIHLTLPSVRSQA